ncbi:MAG: FAD-dependent oxidoreductase, partial [Candidatus Aminicenantales bacterium]
MEKFDLIILGGGAAGFAAAMKAKELKAETLMINNQSVGLGGTCINVGCLPTKYLLYLGELIHRIEKQNFPGIKSSVSINFKEIMEGKDKLIQGLRAEKYEKVLASLSQVKLVEGEGKFISGSQIKVNQQTYTAQKFIIATGSSSFALPVEGLNRVDYLTNIEALQLKKLPESMIILGGRALALEFAQIFSR